MATPPPSPTPVVFKVHRQEPELLRPAKPTPHEFKHLSDIDDQDGFRFHMRTILYYSSSPSMQGKDPVKIIRESFAKALVFYYPLAGRLREGPNRKLTVECTGEGILFIEADADVTLEQLGRPQHPFPGIEDLLFDVPGSSEILNAPLILIQVTRLKCGGFILAFRNNHTTCDGPGLIQFFSAATEIARGAGVPSVLPVWERHLLSSSHPPKVTHRHLEYEENATKADDTELVDRSFLFGPEEMSILRRLVPQGRHSTFEILTACLWRCRTIALQLDPMEEVRVMNVINARYNKFNPPLPKGYYGNAFAVPASATTAGNLIQNPVGYALELVQKAKAQFNEEYLRSVASLMVIKGRPHFTIEGTFAVSDVKNIGIGDLDFGWGKISYGGPADAGFPEFPGVAYFMSSTTKKGEKAILASLSLPVLAMERFAKEVQILLNTKPTVKDIGSEFVKSSL